MIGAGAAGIAAAVSAARAGAKTLLLDARASAGGTGGFSGLTTLCGLFDDAGNHLNDGFAREFADAVAESAPVRMGKVFVLPYRPTKFRETAARLIASTPNLFADWNTPLRGSVCENGQIKRLNDIEVGAVIDCSGTAEVARAIGAETFSTDENTQASAVVFPLRNVSRQLATPADMAQVLLPLARDGFPSLNLQPAFEPGEFTAKFAGSPEQVAALIAFLRANVRGFERCETSPDAITQSHRAGRMVVGQHVLTGAEVLRGERFSDAAARCAWPIEQWDARGSVRFRYLPAGVHYEIPTRSLRAARVKNLFMAGKTISADVDAIASARVMGCCLATGAAAGILAAKSVASSQFR